jgi:hypothetical protein
MADISSFKSNLATGGVRSNQFRCILAFPSAAQPGAAGSIAEFLCKSAAVPSMDVAPVEVMYRGRPVYFAGERTFNPWTITLYNDNNFVLRTAFENWINAMSSPDSTTGIIAPSSYQEQLSVQQLDRNDQVVAEYSLIDAFPTSVGEIQLSWDQNNQIQEYTVTFSYNYFNRV